MHTAALTITHEPKISRILEEKPDPAEFQNTAP
jgi:hypothetical protein